MAPTTVMHFIDFVSAFDSVDRDSQRRIMAADRMLPKLLRLVKAYYTSTKMQVRASGANLCPCPYKEGFSGLVTLQDIPTVI